MSNTTKNNTEPVPFHVTLGAFGYTALGFPTTVCNVVIAASIFKYTALRCRKEMILLMALASADALNMFCFTSVGVYRLSVIASGRHDDFVTSRNCLLPHMWLWSFSDSLAYLMLVIVSLDRLLLVAFSHTYILSFGKKYAWSVVIVAYVSTMAFGLTATITAWLSGHKTPELKAMCYGPMAYSSNTFLYENLYKHWYEHSRPVFALLSVIIFALIWPLHKNNKVSPSNGSTDVKQQLKRQRKMTKTIAISCVCTFFLASLPAQLGYFFFYEEWYVIARISFLLCLVNPLANIFIFHFSNRDLRMAITGLLHCKMLPDNINLWHPPNVKTKPSGQKHVISIKLKRFTKPNVQKQDQV